MLMLLTSSEKRETPRPVKEGGEAKWQINLCKPIPADSIPDCTAEGDVMACAGELSIAANKDTTVITPTLLSTERMLFVFTSSTFPLSKDQKNCRPS